MLITSLMLAVEMKTGVSVYAAVEAAKEEFAARRSLKRSVKLIKSR
jgi:hypothetical protein